MVGGDVTSSPTATVVVAAVGTVPRGTALTRGGGRPEDVLYVTGPLGAAAAGLRLLRSGLELLDERLVRAHLTPLLESGQSAVQERAGNVARAVGADAVALQLQLDLRPHRISACSVAETGHCVD